MALPNKTFSDLVNDMTTAWAANIGFVPALQPGDAILALMEAVAAQALFLEAQAQIVNNLARAQTSTGDDLDTFMAQFDFTRLPATFETGAVVFGKFSASASQYLIPVGTIVQSPGGAAQYQVVADPSQPTWNASLGAYVMAPGQTSLTATVEALVAGTGPNVAPGVLNQIATPLTGIDTVTNPAAINNAIDAETDDAFRARFVLYLQGLSKATSAAILSAIYDVQQGISVELLENETPLGVTLLGSFTAVIDDGSGDPPQSLIDSVFAAVFAVRAFTVEPFVVGPTKVNPTIALNVRVATGFVASDVQAAVNAVVVAAINSIESGAGYLFVSEIEEAALTVAGCLAVQPGTTKINGANQDLALTQFQVPRVMGSAVTVGTY